MHGKRGILLIEGALLVEADMGYICNNNVIVVSADTTTQRTRMHTRGYDDEHMERRRESQATSQEK